MKTLLDVQDELRIVWLLVECASIACGAVPMAEPMQAVLCEAADQLSELRNALEAIRTAPQA